MIDIDFTMMFPVSRIFVNVNLMFEFTQIGQVLPSRIDILPYKMSSFATHNKDINSTIDVLKFILVIFTFISLLTTFQGYSMAKIFSFGSVYENFVDLMIIILQTYSFIAKIWDGNDFDIDPNRIYSRSEREKYRPSHFIARSFQDFLALETIALVFVLFKVVDGLRINKKFNHIVQTMLNSSQLLCIFFCVNLLIQLALTPLAMAVWGHQLAGYKDFDNGMVSVMMIFYSKGNLNSLLEINYIWSFIFLLIYYFLTIFLSLGAFHQIQVDSLKRVVLINGLDYMEL
jgi:hypothetical protein